MGLAPFGQGAGRFQRHPMVAGNIPGRTQTLPLYIYGQVGSLNFAGPTWRLLVGVGIAFSALYGCWGRGPNALLDAQVKVAIGDFQLDVSNWAGR